MSINKNLGDQVRINTQIKNGYDEWLIKDHVCRKE